VSETKSIQIAGGGLAGLTLGIALRRQNIPVEVWESSNYPRHRVCGEFISGAGRNVLSSLGLEKILFQRGARVARTVAFFDTRHLLARRTLPFEALCCSRYVLDQTLATQFRAMGGILHENSRRKVDANEPGVIVATGREPSAAEDGWRYFGLKAHARNLTTTTDLEMHFQRNAYIGVARIAEDRVNICGLFRSREPHAEIRATWRQWLSGAPGSPLRNRIDQESFDEQSFCSVAGLGLRSKSAEPARGARIGDAITMIAPVTGNGMSMAFESAGFAAPILVNYSRGKTDWNDCSSTIAFICNHNFRRRLFWSRWTQWAALSNSVSLLGGPALLRLDVVWKTLFSGTR
jgi:2-polyprenyl-6-methoxyphenol hydroxylase-like FAD-dependent oxidoreductase